MRAVVLIDGDHTSEVVAAALAELPYEVIGAIFAGPGEKQRAGARYGVPLVEGFEGADIVVDLADEPALATAERFAWVASALAAGIPYVGADFRFDPPPLQPFELPSIAVIGTGKRVGKTALAVHLARLLAGEREVVVVCMGRGGPLEAELQASPPTLDDLLALSRRGRHAASDYLEVALLAGVATVGCRRVGGGLAGGVSSSNLADGARLAVGQRPELVVFDGSGGALPPVAVDRRILVAGPGQSASPLSGYRELVSDLVVSIGCRLPGAIPARLRLAPLAPLGPLEGRVAVFSAGPCEVGHLQADVVHVSANLGDRDALRRELRFLEADTYLTELKGAAIEIVAEDALARGRGVVLAGNDVVAEGLDEALLALLPAAVSA